MTSLPISLATYSCTMLMSTERNMVSFAGAIMAKNLHRPTQRKGLEKGKVSGCEGWSLELRPKRSDGIRCSNCSYLADTR
jgi:hypothetical protein